VSTRVRKSCFIELSTSSCLQSLIGMLRQQEKALFDQMLITRRVGAWQKWSTDTSIVCSKYPKPRGKRICARLSISGLSPWEPQVSTSYGSRRLFPGTRMHSDCHCPRWANIRRPVYGARKSDRCGQRVAVERFTKAPNEPATNISRRNVRYGSDVLPCAPRIPSSAATR
jgi:hypothetical protein